ncbi:g2865 [Coccomyxa elongata]
MKWQTAGFAILLLLNCCEAAQLRIGIFPEQNAEGHAAHRTGRHDLLAFKRGLEKLGHAVTIMNQVPEERIHDLLASGPAPEDALLDAILTQGESARAVADFAAQLQIPVVRFVADSALSPGDAPKPLYERPAVLVFASEDDMTAFGDVMEEAVRIVITPSSTGIALTSQRAYQAVDQALRNLHKTFNPDPIFEQKALGLVMIVKNEVATINKTMASMRDMIDYWTIVDTGSTDGTQDAIRECMEGYPGDLYEEPFVDFSTTRNYALRAHGDKTAYAFMVDADYAVNNTWRLRVAAKRMQSECLHRSIPMCAKAIQIRLYTGTTIFYTTRVFPTEEVGTDEGWRYFYPVHESPSHTGIGYMNQYGVDDVMRFPVIKMWNLPITHNKSSTRWKNLDLPLLTAEHEKKPHDTRVVFYLAQTLDLVEDLPSALAMYQKRIDMGGWQQEVFEAHMRRGRIKHDRMALGTEDPLPDFLKAHTLFPERAEPLIWLCWHHHKLMDACPAGTPGTEVCWLRERVAAYHYARKAAALPMPDEGLFMNKPVYDHQSLDALVLHAYYVAKHLSVARTMGHRAAEYVQGKYPGPEHRSRNLLLYRELAEKLLDAAALSA